MDNLADVYTSLMHVGGQLNGSDAPWLLGGSTGCLLQNVRLERKPNDLDIYTDRRFIDRLEETLTEWTVEAVHYSKTVRYSSFLSRCSVARVEVELVADLSVSAESGKYHVEVEDLLMHFASNFQLENETISLMPLEHELIFNLLRDREDRFEPIAETIRERGVDTTLWRALQRRNALCDSFWVRASKLVGFSGEEGSQ